MLFRFLLVAVGSGLGVYARYGVSQFFTKKYHGFFPWGTWWVNVLGTWMIGLFFLVFYQDDPVSRAWLFLGEGFCGGLTTFSTFSVETVKLYRIQKKLSFVYIFSSWGIGVLLIWISQFWINSFIVHN
ncbi:fluoride efflux transporter FluC [Alicyclobacillus tolerans]|uniref:Fluoride-specific ion channel FluC n=1 Tax=Alicyclobacillus tolerans TaxID=90970 RepID=A0A1M6Y7V1_9BACL|nr:CrcB family protein [Alicyclobacillus montanus]SHL14095.1 CrcB protein [Alicyclobacillus montanus]